MGNLLTIRKTRIRSLDRHLGPVKHGEKLVLGVKATPEQHEAIRRIGFEVNAEPGTTLLPADVGAISRFNAHGREIVRRDLPKETRYQQRIWEWEQWHGRGTVPRSKIVDIPYERYPRDFVPPPSIELQVAATPDGQRYVIADAGAYVPKNRESLLHTINLFLEICGECEVLREDLSPFLRAEIRRVNWEILPAGPLPWDAVRRAIEPIVEREPPGNQPPIWDRLTTIEKYGPRFHAVGHAGFSGYFIFGFDELGIYVAESVHYGNATYVFDKNWEQLTQLTKAQILQHDLHMARITHRAATWRHEIRRLLSRPEADAAD